MGRLFLIILIVGSSVLVLLFFPIYLETSAYYDMNGRKLSFCVDAYKFIKLIGGYIATYQGGFALHVSHKKAILIPYSEMNKERKRFSAIRTLRIKSLSLTLETGAEYLIPAVLVEKIAQIYFLGKGGKKKNLESNLWLTDGDRLRISFAFILRFNLFILLRNIIKEKIKVLCQTKIKKSII